MKIPEKLKIGALEFDVIIEEHRTRDAGTDWSASMNAKYQKIFLDKEGGKPDGIMDDLLHEIVEAVNSLNDLGLNHQTISTLATGLHQVLRDNRLVFFAECNGEERSL